MNENDSNSSKNNSGSNPEIDLTEQIKILWRKFTGNENIENKVLPPFPEEEIEEVCQNIFDLSPLEIKAPIINDDVLIDLEIFQGLGTDTNYHIFNEINYCHTKTGSHLLKKILASPTDNIKTLVKRQEVLQKIMNQESLGDLLVDKLKKISEVEDNLLWFWRKLNEETQYLFDMVYFKNKYLKFLNTQEIPMKLYNYYIIIFSPLYGMISPILMVLVPFLMIKFYFKTEVTLRLYLNLLKTVFTGFSNLYKVNIEKAKHDKIGLSWTSIISVLVWFVFYIHGLMSNINNSKNTNRITNIMHEKINYIATIVKEGHNLLEVLGNDISQTDLFIPTKVEKHFKILWHPLFETEPSFRCNKGLILKTYKCLQEKKENLLEMIRYYSNLDCFLSIITLVSSSENIDYCFPEYLSKSPLPVIDAEGIAYPILKSGIITNNMLLGLSNPRNAIITGPNAGGKSTFIKSLCLSILFSQTLGVAPATKFRITPFSLITTYLNIPDSKGKESLFEAEVRRSQEYIKTLQKLDKKKFSFVIMDEIFSSTNPEEGISGAYAIANTISKYSNNMTVLTTHYSYLSNLEKTGKFRNYKIPITRDEEGQIKYLYKIEPGVSNQFIALELLDKKGFDKDIVEEAEHICSQIQKNSKQGELKSLDRKRRVKRRAVKSPKEPLIEKLIDNDKKLETESNKLKEDVEDDYKNLKDSNVDKLETESNKLESKTSNSVEEKEEDKENLDKHEDNVSTLEEKKEDKILEIDKEKLDNESNKLDKNLKKSGEETE